MAGVWECGRRWAEYGRRWGWCLHSAERQGVGEVRQVVAWGDHIAGGVAEGGVGHLELDQRGQPAWRSKF